MDAREFANYFKEALNKDLSTVGDSLLHGLVDDKNYKHQSGVYVTLKQIVEAIDPLTEKFITDKLAPQELTDEA